MVKRKNNQIISSLRTYVQRITWTEDIHNPLIHPPLGSFIIADPTVVPPQQSPDGLWHLFAHSVFGIEHYVSKQGWRWKKFPQAVLPHAYRPHIYIEKGRYFIFYEKITQFFTGYSSYLCMRSSRDLRTWSEERKILLPTLDWHKNGSRFGAILNSHIIKIKNLYRLYYSAGVVKIIDTRYMEPYGIGVAASKNIFGPYVPQHKPLIEPELQSSSLISSGSIRVIAHGDGFLGFQNRITNDMHGKSVSSIYLLISADGMVWHESHTKPIIQATIGWKSTLVYACDVRMYQGKYFVFFNSSNGRFLGTERIGLVVGTVK